MPKMHKGENWIKDESAKLALRRRARELDEAVEARDAEIVRAHYAGMSAREIALAVELSHVTVAKILRSEGIETGAERKAAVVAELDAAIAREGATEPAERIVRVPGSGIKVGVPAKPIKAAEGATEPATPELPPVAVGDELRRADLVRLPKGAIVRFAPGWSRRAITIELRYAPMVNRNGIVTELCGRPIVADAKAVDGWSRSFANKRGVHDVNRETVVRVIELPKADGTERVIR